MLGFDCATQDIVIPSRFCEESAISLRSDKADSSQKAARNDSLKCCGYGQNTAWAPFEDGIRAML
jgi:hypothetical protein